MRMTGVSFLVFITFLLIVIVVVLQTLPPSPLPAEAPAGEFSAERAIRHIQVIARQPHPTGTAANEAVREYILQELKRLGLETESQQDGDLVNVLGRIAGSGSSRAILLTAHYDSTLQSPGASDDGSGVAVLLETARALSLEAPLRNTVMFLFTDHEEGGWYGAQAFIARHPWAKETAVVIGFDAGGTRGPGVLSATSADNGWLIRQLVQADPYLVGSSAVNALADSRTDFGQAFKAAGYSGYAFDLYWDKRDGPEDNFDNLSPASVQHQGYHAVSLGRHFGNLDQLTDPKAPDLVYFSILRLFVARYTPGWAILLAIPILGIFAAVLLTGLRRRIITWGGIGYGVFVMLVGCLIAPVPGLALEVIGRWIPEASSAWDHRLLDQPPQMSVIVLTSLGLIVAWYAWSRKVRTTSLPDLTLGALLPMAAGMLVSAFAFPALSYAFTWPLLFSLLACAYWFYGYAGRKSSRAVVPALLLSGAATIIVVGPGILLGLFDQLALSLVFLGALGGYLLPQIYLLLGYLPGDLE